MTYAHEIIRAPWTQEQVDALNRFQHLDFFHACTCPNKHEDRTLVATKDGWVCTVCDYKQDWALAAMTHVTEKDDPRVTIVADTSASAMRTIAALSNIEAEQAEIADPVKIVPDIAGSHGKAWACNIARGRSLRGFASEDDATLEVWVIEAPWAHPVWHSYVLYLIHLRPMPDGRQTIKYMEFATHELWLYALDPEGERTDMIMTGISGKESCERLVPCNFAAQIVSTTDEEARHRIADAVQKICNGILTPDTDGQQDWVKLFGNNMIKKELR